MNFSYFGIPLVANLLIILLCFQVSSASSGNKGEDELGSSVPTPVTSGESENNTTEFPLPIPATDKVEENAKGSYSPRTSNNDASALIPRWITRRRKTKVLDRPLESQLQFQEERGSEDHENYVESVSTATSSNSPSSSFSATADLSKNVGVVGGGGGDDVQAMSSNANEPITATSQFLGQDVPVFRVTGIQKKQDLISSSVSQKRRLRTKEPVRRQDFDLTSLITEAPPVELTSVSPIESSLGGLTGLQGLPPLSLVQFIKLLVAVTPFMIPIVFVPLLIFTIGIFMIPVSKPNVFLDFGDLRSLNNSAGKQGSSLITTYAGSMKNFTTSVIMPRAYNLARQVADHEQCVERISCEVSNRYLHNSWNGNWRSVANKSWASRITNYLWKTHPILGRMAKSLAINMQPGSEPRSAAENSSNNIRSGRTFPENACSRYSCQPKSFLRKFWPS